MFLHYLVENAEGAGMFFAVIIVTQGDPRDSLIITIPTDLEQKRAKKH
jgi:hypothetical protein